MLAELLRRFEPFTALEWSTLCSVARHARLLKLAGGRVLMPRRHRARGSCYLVKGTVQWRDADTPAQCVVDVDARARRALFITGDDVHVETIGVATLLWLDLDPIEFMLGAALPEPYPVADIQPVDHHWMHRLLSSGLPHWLAPNELQAVFRAFTPISIAAGTNIIEEGEQADAFFVLAQGRAAVRRGCQTLLGLAPGDAFGADGLLSARRRNASVAMLSDGQVMRLAQPQFETLLASRFVRWVQRDAPGAQVIDLGARERGPDALRRLIADLDLGTAYLFTGAAPADRALATYLAAQRGVIAFARQDQAGTVRPLAQLRSEVMASERNTDMG